MSLTRHAGLWIAGQRLARHFIAAGPPCGPTSRLRAAAEALEAESHDQGLRTLWFGATHSECEAMGIDAQRRIHLGDEALLNACHWADIHHLPASLRYQIRRGGRHGFDLIEIDLTPASWQKGLLKHPWLPMALQECRKAWLQKQGPLTLGFTTSSLHPAQASWLEYPQRYLWAAHRRPVIPGHEPKVWGYIIASLDPESRSLRIENFVRAPTAPNGLIEYLLHRVALASRALTFDEINLGLTPLFQSHGESRHALKSKIRLAPSGNTHAPAWFAALAHGLRCFGNPVYSFQGLAQFKQRLHPRAWQALYLAVPADGLKMGDALAVAQAFAKTHF